MGRLSGESGSTSSGIKCALGQRHQGRLLDEEIHLDTTPVLNDAGTLMLHARRLSISTCYVRPNMLLAATMPQSAVPCDVRHEIATQRISPDSYMRRVYNTILEVTSRKELSEH